MSAPHSGERAPEPRLLTSKEAAGLFGVTNDYVTQLVRKGKVRGKLIGRLRYAEEESLRAYLQGNRAVSTRKHKELAYELREGYRAAQQ